MRKLNLLSIVVPCHNEEEVLPVFHDRLMKTIENIGCSYEVVYVNDCSNDKSLEVLKSFYQKNETWDKNTKRIKIKKIL